MDTTSVNHLFTKLYEGINAASEALSVPAGELWRIYVTQAFVNGVTSAVICAVLSIGCYYLIKIAQNQVTRLEKEKEAGRGCADHEGIILGIVFSVIGAVALAIGALCSCVDAIKYLYNPEYYALERILAHL